MDRWLVRKSICAVKIRYDRDFTLNASGNSGIVHIPQSDLIVIPVLHNFNNKQLFGLGTLLASKLADSASAEAMSLQFSTDFTSIKWTPQRLHQHPVTVVKRVLKRDISIVLNWVRNNLHVQLME